MSGKAIHFARVWSCLAHGGWRWIVPQRLHWWRGENLQGGKSSVFYLPVLFEGDVSWQCRRGLKINVAKGGSDSLSAGAVLLGGPIGLGCHFCYLILCMWTRQIQKGLGWGGVGGGGAGEEGLGVGVVGGVCWAATGETDWGECKNVTPLTSSSPLSLKVLLSIFDSEQVVLQM